jgi:hypothetical protein
MSLALKIDEMTTSEKISAMESLWDDLCHHADSIKSPEWHKDILAEREQNLDSGKEKVLNWQDTKSTILESIYNFRHHKEVRRETTRD